VKIQVVRGKIHRTGDAKFSPGNDVESQTLFLKYKSQSSIQESFGGISNQRIRIILTELIPKFTALMAERGLVEKIQWRAEFVS
jgi:hypothetical protein